MATAENSFVWYPYYDPIYEGVQIPRKLWTNIKHNFENQVAILKTDVGPEFAVPLEKKFIETFFCGREMNNISIAYSMDERRHGMLFIHQHSNKFIFKIWNYKTRKEIDYGKSFSREIARDRTRHPKEEQRHIAELNSRIDVPSPSKPKSKWKITPRRVRN